MAVVAVAIGTAVSGVLPCGTVRLQPDCYVALVPGPSRDTLGLVTVDGRSVFAPTGELLLTTVAVEEHLDVVTWVRGAFSARVAQVPRETVFPPGQDRDVVVAESAEAMEDSQVDAIVAALRAVGFDIDVAAERPALPVGVAIDAGAIGGPSAGLMFALTVVELLGPEDLGGGRVVAGTGTIDRGGRVGVVGGAAQKLLGALERDDGRPPSVFLVPVDNLDEVRRTPVPRDVLAVPVASLDDALAALADLRAGRSPEGAMELTP